LFNGGDNYSDAGGVKQAELADLRLLPVLPGGEHGPDGVELTGPNDENRTCRTCAEYDDAIKQGYYAFSSFDIRLASRFEQRCGMLRALAIAKSAAQSFVSNPRTSVLDLELLPAAFFPSLEGHTLDLAGKSYQDLLSEQLVFVRRLSSNMLTVEQPGGMGQTLIEVTRADIDGDGIEDILLFEHCYATEGTMSTGGVRIVTRLAADAMFSEVLLGP
jgi:hypothetical protein